MIIFKQTIKNAMVLLTVIILLSLITLAIVFLTGSKTFIVDSRSMEPGINTGDLVWVKRTGLTDVKLYDIVLYRDPSGGYIIHRVVEEPKLLEESSGEDKSSGGEKSISAKLKGDNAKTPQEVVLNDSNYIGMLQSVWPGFGRVGDHTGLLMGLAAVLVILGCVPWWRVFDRSGSAEEKAG